MPDGGSAPPSAAWGQHPQDLALPQPDRAPCPPAARPGARSHRAAPSSLPSRRPPPARPHGGDARRSVTSDTVTSSSISRPRSIPTLASWREPGAVTPLPQPVASHPHRQDRSSASTGEFRCRSCVWTPLHVWRRIPRAFRGWRGSGLRSSYTALMKVATSRAEVGVRELKNNLSRYLDRVQHGEEVIVTEHGRPVARLSGLDHPTDRLAALIASGAVRPPRSQQRQRPTRRIKPKGPVSDLVAEQRR